MDYFPLEAGTRQRGLSRVLDGLRAAAEPTRLRLLAICSQGEWTVSELTAMLGQSQPRISRHLKILADSGLLERFREGSWVFYRRAQRGEAGLLAQTLNGLLPDDDPELERDRQQVLRAKRARRQQAEAYFAQHAARWDDEHAFAIDNGAVDAVLIDLIKDEQISNLIDIGTGTGRVLRVLAAHIETGLGIDQSSAMLSVARANLDRHEAANCQVRLGDMYQLPLTDETFDAAVLHQVLHFADDPATVLAEASRVLRDHGFLIIVDLAAHNDESMRVERAHRRLGFSHEEMTGWLEAAGYASDAPIRLSGHGHDIVIWHGRKNAQQAGRSIDERYSSGLGPQQQIKGKNAA